MNEVAFLEIEMQKLSDLVWGQLLSWGPKLILAFLTLLIGWKVAKFVGKLMGRWMTSHEIDPTLSPFLISFVTMLIKVGVVVSAITTAGVEATSFAAILAAMGLALGLALSGTLQNFAGGVILLIIRPFKVGDTIEAQGYIGKVTRIEIFQTILVTGDHRSIHIPNGKLQNDSLINYSSLPQRRVDLSFEIGYEADVDLARETIQGVIETIPEILDDPKPLIGVGAIVDRSVNLVVRVWSETSDYWSVHYAMNEKVKKALDEAEVPGPYAKREVYFGPQKGDS